MNNYKKGKNVEEPFERNQIPMQNLPEDFLWMQVKPGTKMRNVLDHAMDEVDNKSRRLVMWSGSGPAVGKVISCVEIMKRQHPEPFHQVNKICYRKVKEYWDPLVEGLDPLVVIRELPTIHILLSKDPVDTSQSGYQAPTNKSTNEDRKKHSVRQQIRPPRRKIDSERFESLGLRSARTKGSRRNQRGGYNPSQSEQKEANFQKPSTSERFPSQKRKSFSTGEKNFPSQKLDTSDMSEKNSSTSDKNLSSPKPNTFDTNEKCIPRPNPNTSDMSEKNFSAQKPNTFSSTDKRFHKFKDRPDKGYSTNN